MDSFHEKIDNFYKKRNQIFKKPLEKIINIMLEKCRYINGESLERHNWGNYPIKLKNIPKNINLPTFEEDLLNSLSLEENEKSIIELLWGDIQLGKRVQACIIMWISIFILKRPVLYIFRNLEVDQKQLQDDILGTEKYNFNIQYIKTLFEEFNNEIQEYFEEINIEYWKDFKLPELKDITSNEIINKLSNKDAINSNDIFCCLMNYKQLEKINKKFSEYISYNDELVNITILVDESDLMCPTSSNDHTNKNDLNDITACEILLAKIYKKVKYTLHITGTAHSLLYNITTRLNDKTSIQIKISKVHKMKRSNDYYGLFNHAISYNTSIIEPWWDLQDNENNKKNSYDIVTDYNKNIKNIINEIIKRPIIKYNSLLISEEKIRKNQFILIDKIIKDFSDLFIVIYHGKCLRLYLSKKYEMELKRLSQYDSNDSLTSQRLYQIGGVYGSSIDTDKSETLPNNYCYFNIDTKILNIKFIYKLLRILFEKSDVKILHKTIITITGKYGERGYSFTSDDYDTYSLHLTDQYFVSHGSINCTDISQKLRLQGKYNDIELKNGLMKLTLWTTLKIKEIMQDFYIKFIKEIEKKVMYCECWEDIKNLLEQIIDIGELKFSKFMKYVDRSKLRKNFSIIKKYDEKIKGFLLINTDDMSESEIFEWCKEKNLPDYNCINLIKVMNINEFIDKYGNYYSDIPLYIPKNKIDNFDRENLNNTILKIFPKLKDFKLDRIVTIIKGSQNNDRYNGIQNAIEKNIPYNHYITKSKPNTYNILIYDKYDNIHITITTNKKCLPKQTNDYINKIPYVCIGDKIKYSILKKEYNQLNTQSFINEDGDNCLQYDYKFPEKYFWKTPDDWLYFYDNNKPKILSLKISSPTFISPVKQTIIPEKNLINSDILLFTNLCCKKTDKKNLRFGIKDIYKMYELWCKTTGKKVLKQNNFKTEFEKLNYKEESKGVDINNKSGKRGYNIDLIDLKTNL
jgi:hypothetical protein